MNRFFLFLLVSFLMACSSKQSTLVEEKAVDSLLIPATVKTAHQRQQQDNLEFWENKWRQRPGDETSLAQYGAALSARFTLYGEIDDLVKADSIYRHLYMKDHGTEAGVLQALSALALSRHRFGEAAVYARRALDNGQNRYVSHLLLFDALLELGKYGAAENELALCAGPYNYGYLFRMAKLKHVQGRTDSAIACLRQAAEISRYDPPLCRTASSNLADFYCHNGEPAKAVSLYLEDLRADPSAYHDLLRLGWMAFSHDKNTALAKKILQYVLTRTRQPVALVYLSRIAEAEGNRSARQKYLSAFVREVTKPAYGDMYNDYLIVEYTGALHDYPTALRLSLRETRNRPTAKSYALYAWSLFRAGYRQEALAVIDREVSGKALEGMELYFMGVIMQSAKRGYAAHRYLEGARTNRFDLGPAIAADIDRRLKG